jgi:Recombination endonuclease VII
VAYAVLCLAEPSQAWWSTPSDELRKYRNEYNAIPANRAKKKARQKAYYYRHRERRLAAVRMVNYKIAPADFEAMLVAQDGKCAICRCAPTARYKGRLKHLAVDHDHVTGRIRALLCNGCNAGLGHFKNNPLILMAAVQYLSIHSSS